MKLISQYQGLKKEMYVLAVGRMVTSLGSMIWPVLTLLLSRKMGMDASSIALTMVAGYVVMLPVNILGGKAADSFNKKYMIIVADTISVFLYVVSAMIPLSLISVVMLIGAASMQQFEDPAYNALIADITKTEDREKAFSLMYLAGNLGMIASPTIAGFLMENHLPLSFLISGLSIGFSTVLITLLVKDITPIKEEGASFIYQKDQEEKSIVEILRNNRSIMMFAIMTAFFWTAYQQYTFLLPLDIVKVHGSQGSMIYGSVASLNCITVVLFTPVLTALLEKVTDLKKFFFGILLTGGGYVFFILCIGFVPAYYGAMLMFTFGEILSTISNGPYLNERIPASHRGRVNSFLNVTGTVMAMVASLLIGPLYDNTGSWAAWSFVLGILVICILMVIRLFVTDRRDYPMLYGGKKI